jgi:DNA-binding HxlR family transcriptional regulator
VRRTSFEDMNCSIAQCLEVVGEWWSLLIVREAFLGVTRFDDLHQRLGMSRSVLTDRLEDLVNHGVLQRVAYQDHPVRYDYRLTDRWAAPDGPPVEMIHKGCGQVADAVAVCSVCGEKLDARSVRVVAGPGIRPENPLYQAPATSN